jgi:ABC-type Fe3+-siderophore transport system permease subunit
MRPLTVSRLAMNCAILAAILFCVMVLALKFGAVHVSLYGLGRDLLRVFMGKSTEISSNYSLILNLRLPRIWLSVLVGASLAIAGTSFQALLRNPLADAFVLGPSGGAALGGIAVLSNHISRCHRRLLQFSRRSAAFSARLSPSPRFTFLAAAKATLIATHYCLAASSPRRYSPQSSFCCSLLCPAATFAAWRIG